MRPTPAREWPRRWIIACAASACRWPCWCNPISNSLLPEIARLRSLFRLRDALRLIDKTIALAALVAVGGCGFALIFRQPAIALLFQRGSFTADSTRLVASAFLALGPSLIGWSLMEILARSLFALDRPWPPGNRGLHPGADQRRDHPARRRLPSGIPRPGRVGRADLRFRRAVRDRPHRPQALARAGLIEAPDANLRARAASPI